MENNFKKKESLLGESISEKGESISEIIDSKRGGYLSVWKTLL